MAVTNGDVWANYAAAIAKAAGLPGAPDNLVLNGTSQVANFATGSSGLPSPPSRHQALYETYTLGDTLAHQKFVYDSADASFFSDYADYIDNLIPKSQKSPSPTQTAQLKLLHKQLGQAQTQSSEDLTKAQAAWEQAEKLFPGQYPSFASYLNTTSWGATINTDSAAQDAANSKLSTILTQIYGQDYVAITLAKTTVDGVRKAKHGSVSTGPDDMVVAAESGKLVVPTYNPGDLGTFSTWVDGIITAHPTTPVPASKQPTHVNITAKSGSLNFSANAYYSHTAWNNGFWFFRSGGSVTHSGSSSTVDTTSSDFDLTIGFDGVTTLDLTRGPWHDSGLMYDFKNPGQLSVPTSLIIGMYPQLELTMDATSFAAAHSAYSSSSGFGAGFFWVSASTQTNSSGVTMHANWDSTSNSVTIAPQSVEPIILGMEMAAI